MFLQVFSDGTVIDSDGVHRVSPADLKPIVESIQSGELTRVRGHCNSPSSDFLEYVHIVVFERRLGRLQAHSFSYSGNPQGCDHAVRHLHTVLEAFQVKLSRQPIATVPATGNGSAVSLTPFSTPAGASPSTPFSAGARSSNSLLPGVSDSVAVPPIPAPNASALSGSSRSIIPLTHEERLR
jgi:hypothetical protein